MDLRDCVKKTPFKVVICVFVSFWALFYMWLFPVEHALNRYLKVDVVESIIGKNINVPVSISQISYETHPDYSVSLLTEQIRIVDKSGEIIKIENFRTRIKIFDLLFNRLSIKELLATNINIKIIKDREGNISFLNFFKDKKKRDKLPKLKISDISIDKYDIFYFDELLDEEIKLSGNSFIIEEFSQNQNINFKTNGNLKIYKKSNIKYSKDIGTFDVKLNSKLPIRKNLNNKDFDTSIVINDFDLKPFSSFLKELNNSDVNSVNGVINADIRTKADSKIKKLIGEIKTKDLLWENKNPIYSTFLKESTKINIDTDFLKENIKINNLSLKSEFHDIIISGDLLHTNTSKPLMDLDVSLYNDSRSMLYYILPSELKFENNIVSKIKKYQPIATFEGKINLKGSFVAPEIIGEIITNNLYINQKTAKNAKSKLKLIFNKKRMQILGEVVPNKGAKVDVEGALNIYGEKNAEFSIKSSPNVNLAVVRAVLLPIQDVFSLNFGILRQILILSGEGDADLKISGTRKNSLVHGRLNFNSAKAKYEGIEAFIENASGYLDFNGKDIKFETTESNVRNYKMKLQGSAAMLGEFDINIVFPEIQTNTLLEITKNSPLLTQILKNNKELEYIKTVAGLASLNLNIAGTAENSLFADFNKLNYNGDLKLKNNTLKLKNFIYPVILNNSNINFSKNSVKSVTNGKILNSPFNFDFLIKENDVSAILTADRFLVSDILSLTESTEYYKKLFAQSKSKIFTKLKATYSGRVKDFNPQKIELNSELLSDGIEPFYSSLGTISLKNGQATIEKLNLDVLNAQLIIDGVINNIFDKKTSYDIKSNLVNFDVDILNSIQNYKILSDDVKKIITAYEKYKGKINGTLNFKNNLINGKLSVKDIEFTHKKMQLPISINNVDILFNGNSISIPTIHGAVDTIPVLIKLDIKDFLQKPVYDGYLTTNLYPSFINKYVNTNLGYPIKLKGELQLKSYFTGNIDSMKATNILLFPVNSDISYMGASLDDKEFEREIKLDMHQISNVFKINKATLSKFIRTQNGTKSKHPYVSANGTIQIVPNDIIFKNFNIKTHEYTNSKIFNILFKKSILKYGKFDCNLNINGAYTNPNILGYINFKNLDMPLYETIVKDIFATFKQNTIDLKVFGSVYDTEITAVANAKNVLSLPFHIKTLEVNAGYLDLDNIFNSFSVVSLKNTTSLTDTQQLGSIEKTQFLPLIIDKGHITAEKVYVRGIPATNLISQISLGNNNVLKLQDFNFNFAQGKVIANGSYDFNTNILEGNCVAKSIDANKFAQIFLNLKNQIFGDLDGTVYFNTNGVTPIQRLENLKGNVDFKITDGKMPKLGSLEYLLRAANLIKSGITGFTINNMIDLLIPVKTGDFSFITGNLIIDNGIAKNIEISSTGKNLSLYITGNADIINQDAKMVVLGRLSKKLSTILGPIGNASLNTLFNFIPGISDSEKENILIKEMNKIPFLEISDNNDYRFFQATIDGNLNSEEFVQTFKWLE